MVTLDCAEEGDWPRWSALDGHMARAEYAVKVRERRAFFVRDGAARAGVLRYNLFWDQIPFLTLIFLEPRFRGKGVGREAMRLWEERMRSLGHPLTMTSTQSDEGAQHFYRKLGYRDAGCLLLDVPPFCQPLEIFLLKAL